MSIPKVVVIGCGKWGKNLVRVFSEMGNLYGIWDINPLQRCGKSFESWEAVLATDRVDAVAIATPAGTHYELAKQALLAGKDVFVEKPFAMNCEEGEELTALATEKNRILMVGHILAYHPAIIKLKEMISAGELGKIHYIYSNRLNLGRLRTEENVLWSFAPHDISAILGLMGEEPSQVISHEGTYISKGISDTTMTFMEFPSGAKAHIFVSWLHPYKEQKLVVIGSKSMVVFDDLTAEKLRVYPHKILWREGKTPIAEKAEYELATGLLTKAVEPLKLECEHFLHCIKTREKPRTDGKEALAVLRVLESCFKTQRGCSEGIFVHESAFVDEEVTIGKGTKIWHFSHILKNTKIGENCIIGQNVMIGPNVKIGDNVKIQNNVSVYEGVTLENDVFCGPSCVFTNVTNPRSHIPRKNEFKKTLVKQGATIGANATILCGITIGEYAFIGAGAVVTKSVTPYFLIYSNSAMVKGTVDRKGNILK